MPHREQGVTGACDVGLAQDDSGVSAWKKVLPYCTRDDCLQWRSECNHLSPAAPHPTFAVAASTVTTAIFKLISQQKQNNENIYQLLGRQQEVINQSVTLVSSGSLAFENFQSEAAKTGNGGRSYQKLLLKEEH